MLTTIQDLGRIGWHSIGVARGGAADPLSLRAGNRLLGNDDGAAALEMTLVGGRFQFLEDSWCVVAGDAAAAHIDGRQGQRSVADWLPFEIRSGECLATGPIRRGVRSYLCVAGGISVPRILGSRATHLAGGFGGLDGRAVRAGDVIAVGRCSEQHRIRCDLQAVGRAQTWFHELWARRTIRAVGGAHQDTFDASTIRSFWESEFEVSMQSNRTGLRLEGHKVGPSALGGHMPSEGMMPGAVQVPASGEPIVLLVDHPTTGGYPVIACAASVDHALLGQIRPRDCIRFERVSRSEARGLVVDQEQRFDAEVPPA